MSEMLHNKYLGMEMSSEARILLNCDSKKFISCCNGVGSRVGYFVWVIPMRWVWHWIPNTIWGLNITPATDVHDVEYTFPKIFESIEEALAWKKDADERLYDNIRTLILRQQSWKWLEKVRLRRAWIYYELVSSCGESSFLEGKEILN